MARKLILMGILAVMATVFAAADPAEGFWISVDEKTGKETAGWQIYIEGGKLYGKVLSIAGFSQDEKAYKCESSYRGFPVAGDVKKMTVVGTPWIFGLSPDRQAGHWKGGNVVDPNDGKMYGCEITFHAANGNRYKVDTLEMRGKIGPFGRSQFWKKATQTQAGALR
ncbi:MAG: DUF2147 domain-containing protein [Treponema sp.]|nr:DUF2147 domain-containing protein [Treponema sp.]